MPARLCKSSSLPLESHDDTLPLRPCQTNCLSACAKGARIIEMACGTGKTRVIKELARNISGRVPCPLKWCAKQFGTFAPDFPGFCKVGTGHNQKINFDAKGFIAVKRMPKYKNLYRFSATHTEEPDFRYPMGQAIEDGVLCDYDITVPAVTEHHSYVCLADLLLKQAGRFRRVLAYCNTVAEAKKFRMVLEELGLAAWHINGRTCRKERMAAIEEFSGSLTSPVHVMVTAEVLGEGINIPNADTCIFVEPRNSYRSVIQAIGRVLRHHPGKTLAHIVLPAVAVSAKVESEASFSDLASLEMEGAAGIGQGDTATPRPEQALTEFGLPVADTPEGSTQEDWAGLPTFRRGKKRGISRAKEEPTRQEEPYYRAAGIMTKASQEGFSYGSFNLAPSSPPSSETSTCVRSVPPAPFSSHRHGPAVGQAERVQAWEDHDSQEFDVDSSPMPQILSASGRVAPISPGCVARDGFSGEENHCDNCPGEHVADEGCNGHGTIQEAIQKDITFREHRHDRDGACSGMERRALRSSVPEAQQRGGAGPPSRRVQLKSSLNPSDPNQLYNNQLERFLSLLVQADSRLVGSTVYHRIQLVDSRMAVEGQELDSLTEVVYRRLTAILRQRDPWEERLQSLEAYVHEKGRLPLRRVRDGASLAYWLNTQQCRFRAGVLLESRWRRLLNSSSLLIRQRAQGWLSGDPDGRFKRRCLELKAYLETNGELPCQTGKTPNSQSHRLALWLRKVLERRVQTKPDRRTLLESVHPLVAHRAEQSESRSTTKIDLPKWQQRLQKLVACVQAKGHLPRSTGSEKRLYEWLDRNLLRLQRLPRELVKQLHDSHPLVAAKVRAAQA